MIPNPASPRWDVARSRHVVGASRAMVYLLFPNRFIEVVLDHPLAQPAPEPFFEAMATLEVRALQVANWVADPARVAREVVGGIPVHTHWGGQDGQPDLWFVYELNFV